MMFSAAVLCGNGAIMLSIRDRMPKEKKNTSMAGILGKKSMMGIFAWMGWYIQTGHPIPGFWNTRMYIVRQEPYLSVRIQGNCVWKTI